MEEWIPVVASTQPQQCSSFCCLFHLGPIIFAGGSLAPTTVSPLMLFVSREGKEKKTEAPIEFLLVEEIL